MTIFEANPQIVKITDPDLLSKIRTGFMFFDGLMYPLGIKVFVVVTPLPEGNYSIACSTFPLVSENTYQMREEKRLGYITQEGLKMLQPHTHKGCNTYLELCKV